MMPFPEDPPVIEPEPDPVWGYVDIAVVVLYILFAVSVTIDLLT